MKVCFNFFFKSLLWEEIEVDMFGTFSNDDNDDVSHLKFNAHVKYWVE